MKPTGCCSCSSTARVAKPEASVYFEGLHGHEDL